MLEQPAQVLSKATLTQQQQQRHLQHRQPDAHTCSRLVHALLEPLADIGPFERQLCQGTISAMHRGYEAADKSGTQGSVQ